MKKNLLYLMALISVIFASCDPLEKTYEEIEIKSADKIISLTLTAADYDLLPSSNYAKKGGYFASSADANSSISVIFNAKYPQLPNGTKANVIYNLRPSAVKLTDSVFANVQYTVTNSDYTDGSAAVGNGNFKTYNATQALAFLDWKYPKASTPINKLVLLTYQFFQSNATPSAGITVTEAFLFNEIGWQKIYLVNANQYASVGRGINSAFTSGDVSTLPTYFNNFLKADPATPIAKVGDLKLVSYKYQQSSSVVHQKVYTLIFDGLNWVVVATPVNPLPFIKKNGTWIPDPTVYYTLIKADFAVLLTPAAEKVGTALGKTNAAAFASFDVTGGNNSWTEAQINDALILMLNTKYESAPVDETVVYNITYALFRGATPTVTKAFSKAAAGFKLIPAS